MEATSIASTQGRLAGTRFAVLVFTNLTQDHLDFHGTMEDYFEAKRALFAQAARAVVNVGDEWGRRLAADLPNARTFTPDDDLEGVDLKLRGRFNRANALGAIWAARELGIDEDAIRSGIAAVAGVPGRFESIEAGQPFAVIVDYAHTPDSLVNVLESARGLGRGRLIVVFGAGGDRDREKRPLMGRAAARLADRAIVTTDNPRSEDPAEIAAEVADGRLEIVLDRRAAIEAALGRRRPGRRGRDRRQGRGLGDGARRTHDPVRRPRGRARGALVIPLEPRRDRAARPADRATVGRQRSPACRSTRAGSTKATCSSPSAEARTSSSTRWRAARRPHSCRPTRSRRSRRSPAPCATRSQARVVAITGSTGKTSTKDILFALCAPHRRTIANEGNYNTEIGVPLTLCRIEEDTEICISELGDARARADRVARVVRRARTSA